MRLDREFVYTLGLVAVALLVARHLWLPQLASSFWLDETGTAWMIQGSLGDAVSHSLRFQGGHTLYVVIQWVIKEAMGLGELPLRMPSVLGMVGASYLTYRLGTRIYDHWAGLIAATFLVCLPAIGFAATDARPYALAVMFLVGSTLALINWLDSLRTRDAIVYAASTAAVLYLHYMFVLPLLAHLVFLLFRIRAGERFALKPLLLGPAFLIAFVAPTIPNLLRVMSESRIFSNPYLTEPHQIFEYLLPSALMVVVLPAFLLACLVSPPKLQPGRYLPGGLPLAIAWIAIPVAFLYISAEQGTNVFVPRYFLMVIPAIALLVALGIRQLGHLEAQIAILVLAGATAMRVLPPSAHSNEDWRAAAAVEREAVVDPETPVLMFSGFIEANQVSFLTDPERASYLNAPAAMYRMEGRLIPLPFSIAGDTEAYLQEVVRDELLGSEGFILVTRGETHKPWIDAQVQPAGFTPTLLATFEHSITVFRYSRST